MLRIGDTLIDQAQYHAALWLNTWLCSLQSIVDPAAVFAFPARIRREDRR